MDLIAEIGNIFLKVTGQEDGHTIFFQCKQQVTNLFYALIVQAVHGFICIFLLKSKNILHFYLSFRNNVDFVCQGFQNLCIVTSENDNCSSVTFIKNNLADLTNSLFV